MKWRLLRSPIEREDDVVSARQRARLLAETLGLSRQDQTGLATAVSEIARNAYGYAGGGTVDYGVDDDRGRQSLVVHIADTGRGIADLPAVLGGHYVSTTGMGLGIVGARRLVDSFAIASGPGDGTSVTLAKRLPEGRATLGGPEIAALSDLLRRQRDADPQQAVRAQNRDLLESLAALAEREEEARGLNAALRDAHASLERRVGERTAELARANEHLRAEAAERERVEAELRQAQKMEAVGQLTGGIAHDFNNLLTGIIGSLDLLRLRTRQGRHDKVERYIEMAVASADRAAALTHRLLAFARPQALAPTASNANEVIRDMQDLLHRTMPANIAFHVAAAADLWPALCDAHQLENAILNLCINARDAMPDGGRLVLETSNVHLDVDHVARHPSASPGDHVCLTVSDTGTGMSPEVLARAFEPFFTTKPVGKGTGLGMAMIYGFAMQSKGHCRIESAVGRGTRIDLYLPRHRPSADGDAASDPSIARSAGSGGAGTILLVEQDATVREVAEEVLREAGHRVILAEDGVSALRHIDGGEPVDVIVTDIGLSGDVSARHLTERARSSRPGLQVLFITGYADEAEAADGAAVPGTAVLSKPFQMRLLVERLATMLGDAG